VPQKIFLSSPKLYVFSVYRKVRKSPLEKGIIGRAGTGRYNQVFEGSRKKISWKTTKQNGMSEERKF
jgi:hypothetical protein